MTLKERANHLKTDIPAVFLALKQKETPLLAKIMAGLTLAYALSPIDLIPDFIPVLGYLDDVIVLPLLIAVTIRLIPPKVFQQCQQDSQSIWKEGRPKKWYFAVPIILLWGIVLILVVKWIRLVV
ncbi:MAG: YkvA family protein [Pygmaiobacter sp.]